MTGERTAATRTAATGTAACGVAPAPAAAIGVAPIILCVLAIAVGAAVPGPPLRAEPVLLDGIAAQVGDEIILESEIEEQLTVARLQFGIADSALADAREEIVKRMIDEKVIIQEARARGVTVGSAEVERAVETYLERIRESLGSEEALAQELEREGITYDDLVDRYRDSARKEILYTRLVQREIYADIDVADEEVEGYFNEHRGELPQKVEQVRLSHIFVGIRPADDAIDAAQDKLDQVRRRLAAGETFGKIASELSDDPGTRDQGGDLGWLQRGQIDARIEEVAFELEVGEVSEPFQTQFGVELIKVTAKDEEKDQVRARHILVLLRATRSDYERARERAEKALKLARSGTGFAQLVQEYSDDEDSKDAGGDIGTFQVPDLVPFVAGAVAGLDVGDLSEVVETEQGFHVFKVTERQAGGEWEFSEVSEQIRNKLIEERAAKKTDEWLREIRGEYFIRRTDQRPAAVGGLPGAGAAAGSDESSGAAAPKVSAEIER